tara:strand:- start:1 stop:285 length:285 start_codon:yes stop_codon:yes gene_type:complete
LSGNVWSDRFVYWYAGEYDVIDGVTHYIPSIVFENKAGHNPCRGQGEGALPYYWGTTPDECKKYCDEANERIGISHKEAFLIVASSMRAGKVSA